MVNSETSSPYLILMLITWYVQANPVQVTFATEFQISRKKIALAYHQNYLTFLGAMLSLLLQGNNP